MNPDNTRRWLKSLLVFIIALHVMLPMAFAHPQSAVEEIDAEEQRLNLLDSIMAESDGNVEIIIEDSLLERILQTPVGHSRKGKQRSGEVIRRGINKLSGYRIQVFGDGRNQHSLEARAKTRGSAIVARFPKYRGQIYTFSSSPNWFTRVGNFRTHTEAAAALSELKSAFPAFASEMRIVQSKIVVIK